jgi:hypothetical protein
MITQEQSLLRDIRLLGSVTRSELSRFSGVPINSVCRAVFELRAKHLISERRPRTCVVTGHKAHPLVATKKRKQA